MTQMCASPPGLRIRMDLRLALPGPPGRSGPDRAGPERRRCPRPDGTGNPLVRAGSAADRRTTDNGQRRGTSGLERYWRLQVTEPLSPLTWCAGNGRGGVRVSPPRGCRKSSRFLPTMQWPPGRASASGPAWESSLASATHRRLDGLAPRPQASTGCHPRRGGSWRSRPGRRWTVKVVE
jgi:hypothetical protein